ncbi:MAG: hypothetical protein R3E08_02715 [Thiotrichaceae bacterium]
MSGIAGKQNCVSASPSSKYKNCLAGGVKRRSKGFALPHVPTVNCAPLKHNCVLHCQEIPPVADYAPCPRQQRISCDNSRLHQFHIFAARTQPFCDKITVPGSEAINSVSTIGCACSRCIIGEQRASPKLLHLLVIPQ